MTNPAPRPALRKAPDAGLHPALAFSPVETIDLRARHAMPGTDTARRLPAAEITDERNADQLVGQPVGQHKPGDADSATQRATYRATAADGSSDDKAKRATRSKPNKGSPKKGNSAGKATKSDPKAMTHRKAASTGKTGGPGKVSKTAGKAAKGDAKAKKRTEAGKSAGKGKSSGKGKSAGKSKLDKKGPAARGKGKRAGRASRVDVRTQVPADVRRQLRSAAKARGTSVDDVVASVLEGWLPS